MRFYVHHEEEPDFTLAVEWAPTDARTVAELRADFAAAFTAATGATVYASELQLKASEGGAILPLTTCVASVATQGGDFFVVRGPPMPAPTAPVVAAPSAAAASSGDDKEAQAALIKSLNAYLKRAEKAWAEKSYRKARALYEEYMAGMGSAGLLGKPSAYVALALRKMGEIEVINGRPDQGLPFLERAELAAPSSVDVHLKLSDCHVALGDYPEAVSAIRTALKCVTGDAESKKVKDLTKRIKLKLGSTLFRGGDRSAGGQILTQLLQEDMDEPKALEAYGEAALELGQVDDALKIFLRLVVNKSEDEAIRRLLARTLKTPGGLEQLREHLPDQESSAAALAFLATVTKDHSGVTQAIDIYEQVTRLAPSNASYALNLVHVIELDLDYPKALAALHTFLGANPSRSIGTLSCSELAAALPPTFDGTPALKPAGTSRAVPEGFPPDAGGDVEKLSPKPAGTYGSDELDLLAVCYTATKVCYAAGALEALPALLALIEPARAVKDLHLTLVRNENAYYCCVAQLASSLPLPLPDLPPLYVVGDSHSLSPAWRTVCYKGAEHLLKPMLVTGCKIWHLRKESDFFPRANFETAINAMPQGASAVFCFGEIDCREGLLVAVERCRYESLQLGVEATVAIYVKKLKELVANKGFTILVHPVPPVLNETRYIVKTFNGALKAALAAEPRLTYLDFFDSLLSPDGEKLADGLALDGTHLHPSYVQLMEKALPQE